jgi:hypothetical protein
LWRCTVEVICLNATRSFIHLSTVILLEEKQRAVMGALPLDTDELVALMTPTVIEELKGFPSKKLVADDPHLTVTSGEHHQKQIVVMY